MLLWCIVAVDGQKVGQDILIVIDAVPGLDNGFKPRGSNDPPSLLRVKKLLAAQCIAEENRLAPGVNPQADIIALDVLCCLFDGIPAEELFQEFPPVSPE